MYYSSFGMDAPLSLLWEMIFAVYPVISMIPSEGVYWDRTLTVHMLAFHSQFVALEWWFVGVCRLYNALIPF